MKKFNSVEYNIFNYSFGTIIATIYYYNNNVMLNKIQQLDENGYLLFTEWFLFSPDIDTLVTFEEAAYYIKYFG